jgi:uncharacterized Fe-S cluster-containing radical SAM superfamily protein
MRHYIREITPRTPPFDPVALARETENIICKGTRRKYTSFHVADVYGGIATGYTVGCHLRCVYCWVNPSRDYPERYGKYYTPGEAVDNLEMAAREKGVRKMRISGAEPTLCRSHLLKILQLAEEIDWLDLFILETNGILLGNDISYARELSRSHKVHVRVCLKAGTSEGFRERTGAMGDYFHLPFRAVENLKDSGVSFHVAAMTDPRIMSFDERRKLISRLAEIDPSLVSHLEEEIIDPYDNTLKRLERAGVDLDWEIYRRW